MKIKTLIFDLDDTLYDYDQYVRGGFRCVAKKISKYNNEFDEKEAYEFMCREYFRRGNRSRVFQSFLANVDASCKIERMVDWYNNHDLLIQIDDDSIQLLHQLSNEYNTVLLTDGRRASHKIEHLGISHFFDTIVINEETSKKQKDCYVRLISELDLNPCHCMTVGDDPIFDHLWPKKMGMQCILKLGGIIHEPPRDLYKYDGYIHKLTDLNYFI